MKSIESSHLSQVPSCTSPTINIHQPFFKHTHKNRYFLPWLVGLSWLGTILKTKSFLQPYHLECTESHLKTEKLLV